MARRNGRGSKSLAETITQFERSELRLLKSASRAQILSAREVERLEDRFTQSSSQKRSSDVLSAAIHLNKLLASALRGTAGSEPQSSRSELEVLVEMGNVMRAQERPADALAGFLRLLRELVPFDRAALFIFDSQEGRLEPVAAIGDHIDLIQGVEFDLGTGFSSWVAKRRKATLLTELQRPARDGEMPLRCFMSVPVVVHGDLVGVLNLGNAQPRAFDDDHLRLAATFAMVLGATLTREVAERMLAANAAADPLTGALTEKQLERRVYEETDRSRRYGDPLTLVLVKMVDYEAFIEAHGLATGDAALRELGRLLCSTVRCADQVGRVATDEFGLLLVHTAKAEAHAIAERVAEVVARHSFPRRKRLKVDTALVAFPEGGDELKELLATARRRLAAARAAAEAAAERN